MKILIRGPDTVGSFVLATPFFRELRRNFKNDYIVLCIKPLVYELAVGCPYVDKVLIYEKNILNNIKRFKQENFNKVFLLSGSFESALVCYLSGIKVRIGYPHDYRGFLLTNKIVENKRRHYVDYLLYILEFLGYEVKERTPELYINTKDSKFEKYDYIFSDNKPVVGITYSSIADDARKWPLDYVIKLSDMLAHKGYKTVLLGKVKNHKQIIKDSLIDLINKTTLTEFVYILKKLHVYISVSTGGIHIASTIGIPVIGIYTPGDEIGWAPYSSNSKIITKYVKCAPCNQHKMKYCKNNVCMQMIKPEDVFNLIFTS